METVYVVTVFPARWINLISEIEGVTTSSTTSSSEISGSVNLWQHRRWRPTPAGTRWCRIRRPSWNLRTSTRRDEPAGTNDGGKLRADRSSYPPLAESSGAARSAHVPEQLERAHIVGHHHQYPNGWTKDAVTSSPRRGWNWRSSGTLWMTRPRAHREQGRIREGGSGRRRRKCRCRLAGLVGEDVVRGQEDGRLREHRFVVQIARSECGDNQGRTHALRRPRRSCPARQPTGSARPRCDSTRAVSRPGQPPCRPPAAITWAASRWDYRRRPRRSRDSERSHLPQWFRSRRIVPQLARRRPRRCPSHRRRGTCRERRQGSAGGLLGSPTRTQESTPNERLTTRSFEVLRRRRRLRLLLLRTGERAVQQRSDYAPDDRGEPEQPQLAQRPSLATESEQDGGPVERAGLTEVLVTGC